MIKNCNCKTLCNLNAIFALAVFFGTSAPAMAQSVLPEQNCIIAGMSPPGQTKTCITPGYIFVKKNAKLHYILQLINDNNNTNGSYQVVLQLYNPHMKIINTINIANYLGANFGKYELNNDVVFSYNQDAYVLAKILIKNNTNVSVNFSGQFSAILDITNS